MIPPAQRPAIHEVWRYSTRAIRQNPRNILTYQLVNTISHVTGIRIYMLALLYGNRCKPYWAESRSHLGVQGHSWAAPMWNISTPSGPAP